MSTSGLLFHCVLFTASDAFCLLTTYFMTNWACCLSVFFFFYVNNDLIISLFSYFQAPSGRRQNPVGQVKAAAARQPVLRNLFKRRPDVCHSALCWDS